MKKIKVSEINASKMKNNEFENLIPEFYELGVVIENSDWHDYDSVLNHTLVVLEKLEELFRNIKDKISAYLSSKITNHTRKEVLLLGALFHDIAKKETLIKDGNLTSCPNHEEQGSIKLGEILNRFDLSEKEKDIVIKIVKNHGVIHDILNSQNNKLDEEYQKFKSDYSDIFLELILLAMADTLGSQLNYKKPDEFNFRIAFYKRVLEEY